MRLHVVDHPLVAHKLTTLRDRRTDSATFRRLADELVTLLAYEATRDVRTEQVDITTPGGTLVAAIHELIRRGADDVTAVVLLAAPEGVELMERELAGTPVTVVTAAVDERLNEHGYIVPGLGDAGDRLYGAAE